jgi:pre-mRNA-splicing factor CWC26
MKKIQDYYGEKPSGRSLNSFKQENLEIPCNFKVISKNTEKNDNWLGYSSSSSPERIDSDSEEQVNHDSYIEALSKGIEIDENIRKVPQKKYATSSDVTWLGVRPEFLESHSLVPNENLKTIYRDKQGVVVEKNKTKKNENEEKLALWASGQVQIQAKKRLEEEIEKEKEKPFARYEIESQVQEEFKRRKRFGDPLSQFRPDLEKKVKMNWENRFGILPGKMWDGVDRTNGFEQRWLAKQGRKVWENSMAHKEFASEL